MEDPIHKLPTNNIPVTEEEKEIMKWLFQTDDKPSPHQNENEDNPPKPQSTQQPSSSQFIRSIIILGVLFFIFQLPIWKTLITRFFPILENDLLFALIKTLFFIILISVLSFWIQSKRRSST